MPRGLPVHPLPAGRLDQLDGARFLAAAPGQVRRLDVGLPAERREGAAREELGVGRLGDVLLAAGDRARRQQVEPPVFERSPRGGARRQQLLGAQEVMGLIGVESRDQAGAPSLGRVLLGDFLEELARALQIPLAQGLGGRGITGGCKWAEKTRLGRPARFQGNKLGTGGDTLEKTGSEQSGDEQGRSHNQRALNLHHTS